jgi:hypothetical protein
MADNNTANPPNDRKSVDSAIKVIETKHYEGVNVDMAEIMAKHAPDPFGRGYLKLYAMVALIFLNSTMNGKSLPYASDRR